MLSRSFALRVVWIVGPARRIIFNVLSNAGELCVGADDVLVVIALPQAADERRPSGSAYAVGVPFRGQSFEPVHYVRQRHRRGNPPWLPSLRRSVRLIRAGTGACVPRRGNPQWLPGLCGARHLIRAGTGACPYKYNNSVDVVRHDGECIDLNTRIMSG